MRITDAKAMTIREDVYKRCPICEKPLAGDDAVRVSIAYISEDLYVHNGPCYTRLRDFCEVEGFAKLFGA